MGTGQEERRNTGGGMVIVVTGATSGMGKATIERLSVLGHRCYGTVYGIDMDPAWATLPYRLQPCDVTDQASVDDFVAWVLGEAGRIDVLVNCAGFGLGGGVEDTTVEEAEKQFDVNYFGAHRMTRAVMPAMRAQGGGRVISISSMASVFTIPFQSFYSSSKRALDALMEAVRMEGRAFGISACCVNPGDARTGFTAARVRARACVSGSPYYELAMRSIERMSRDEMRGMSPDRVARLICRLVAAPRVKPRYFVETKYKLIMLLKRLLPDTAVERLLMKIYIE